MKKPNRSRMTQRVLATQELSNIVAGTILIGRRGGNETPVPGGGGPGWPPNPVGGDPPGGIGGIIIPPIFIFP